jgi:hypothetical protein
LFVGFNDRLFATKGFGGFPPPDTRAAPRQRDEKFPDIPQKSPAPNKKTRTATGATTLAPGV